MPSTIQETIAFLDNYADIPYTIGFRFTLLHIYAQRPALSESGQLDGYFDSMIFSARLFNPETMTSVWLHHKDSIHFDGIAPQYVRIFCDGSTLIKFREPVTCNDTQDIFISK